jgi:hypothetical protein
MVGMPKNSSMSVIRWNRGLMQLLVNTDITNRNLLKNWKKKNNLTSS